MTGAVSFSEWGAAATGITPPSDAAVRAGASFAGAIPPLSERGFQDAALWWGAWIGGIFPLNYARPDPADDGAKKLHPRIGSGDQWTRPSRDLAEIAEWWSDADMLCNIGFAPLPNGLLIIDIDPRNGGNESWRALCDEHGIDDSSCGRSLSPRGDGGRHLWFAVPPDVIAENDLGTGQFYPHSPLARGVDRPWQVPVPPSVRFVAVDPSSKDPGQRHAFRPYVWVAGDPRALPVAPPVLLGDGIASSASVGADGSSAGSSEDVGAGGVASGRISPNVVDTLVQEGVPVGQQSYVFKRMACSMVRRRYSDLQIVETLVETAARSPVGDPSHPWSRGDLESMTQAARRYITSEDQRERVQAARYGSIARAMFFGGST